MDPAVPVVARAAVGAKSAGAAAAERAMPSKASLRSSPSTLSTTKQAQARRVTCAGGDELRRQWRKLCTYRTGRQWQAVVACLPRLVLGLRWKGNDEGERPPAAGQREAVLVTAAMAHSTGQPVPSGWWWLRLARRLFSWGIFCSREGSSLVELWACGQAHTGRGGELDWHWPSAA